MSSPIYELLKRPDELFIVEHAHLQPRFVEDSVRFPLKAALDRHPELDDGTISSPARRTSRRSTATTSSPNGRAPSASCGPARRRAGAEPYRAARLADRLPERRADCDARTVDGAHARRTPAQPSLHPREPPALGGDRAQRSARRPTEAPEAMRRAHDIPLAGGGDAGTRSSRRRTPRVRLRRVEVGRKLRCRCTRPSSGRRKPAPASRSSVGAPPDPTARCTEPCSRGRAGRWPRCPYPVCERERELRHRRAGGATASPGCPATCLECP